MRETCVNAINKMIESIDKVFKYINDMSYEDFAKNDMVIDATVFSICLIGENVKNISEDIQNKYSNIMWHVLKGLRNRIVHDYDGINLELIWSIIQNDLLPLKNDLKIILAQLENV